MKVIVAGSRDITDYLFVDKCIIESNLHITALVSGNARGVDQLGERWAKEHNIPIEFYPVTKEDWNTFGKKAGHLRNLKMAQNADALLAIWDGVSPGTKNMIENAIKHNLKLEVRYYDSEN